MVSCYFMELFIHGENCYQIICVQFAFSKLEDLERQLYIQPSTKVHEVIYQQDENAESS